MELQGTIKSLPRRSLLNTKNRKKNLSIWVKMKTTIYLFKKYNYGK